MDKLWQEDAPLTFFNRSIWGFFIFWDQIGRFSARLLLMNIADLLRAAGASSKLALNRVLVIPFK